MRPAFGLTYRFSRLLSLDGRPLQGYEDDLEVPWPSLNQGSTPSSAPPAHTLPGTMPYIIPVIRCIPQLRKTLKAPTIARATLATYDEYFHSIMISYPEMLQTTSTQHIDPYLLHAVFPLQAARIILYRHNLTIQCTRQERNEAMDNCLRTALDTVSYIKRCLASPPPSPERLGPTSNARLGLEEKIRMQADHFICKHIWRTTLILCFRGDYDSAMVCVRLSSIIGDMRKVNMACGRNLSWFLGQLLSRARADQLTSHQLEMDEEMVAYASGDLQGDADNAWVWAGGNAPAPEGAAALSAPQASGDKPPLTALLTEKEMNDWGGWERVESLVQELMQEQERQRGKKHSYQDSQHNNTKRVKLSPSIMSTPTKGPSPTPPVGASRMSIASII
jgi:hypothetical protein